MDREPVKLNTKFDYEGKIKWFSWLGSDKVEQTAVFSKDRLFEPGCIVNLGVIPVHTAVNGRMASEWHPLHKDID